MLLYKEKGVEYKCITINCVVNILSMYSSGCLVILLTNIYWVNSCCIRCNAVNTKYVNLYSSMLSDVSTQKVTKGT